MPRWYDEYDYAEYVSVSERRRKAQREAAKLKNASPVIISGRAIAQSFWGKSWCRNLERYSDYANRLPRGRTYLRSGCVVDLQVHACKVEAVVIGSQPYEVTVNVAPILPSRWKAVCHDCAGAIDSLIELLEGRFSKVTMERLCRQQTGLFPTPPEMKFRCSCPDKARMCKHVASVLYGIGARLDSQPELLFKLRDVNQQDLITNAGARMGKSRPDRVLKSENLSELFGIDIAVPKRRRRGG